MIKFGHLSGNIGDRPEAIAAHQSEDLTKSFNR